MKVIHRLYTGMGKVGQVGQSNLKVSNLTKTEKHENAVIRYYYIPLPDFSSTSERTVGWTVQPVQPIQPVQPKPDIHTPRYPQATTTITVMTHDIECDNCGHHHNQRRCPECGWRNR